MDLLSEEGERSDQCQTAKTNSTANTLPVVFKKKKKEKFHSFSNATKALEKSTALMVMI